MKKRLNEYWAEIGMAAVLAVLIISGNMDARDAETERAHYCDMVESGAWPDYRGTAKDECRR